MNRQEKEQLVGEIRDLLDGAHAVILTHYTGLDVASMVKLRAALRKSGAGMRVMKNTLAVLATTDTDFSGLHPFFKGPTGVVYTHEDAGAAAKVIMEFAKDHPALKVQAGYLDGGKILDPSGVESLSKLPGKDQLRAMLLSTLGGVPRKFVGLLAATPRNFVGVLEARRRSLAAE